MMFLQSVAYDGASVATGAGIMAFFIAMGFIFVLVALALWVYSSWAYMVISRKLKQDTPGLAWIPGIGPAIVAFKTAKMHWWPWILLVGYLIPFLAWVLIVFYVYLIIWHWRMFESLKKPGWWAILMLIPVVNLIIIGIAAWGK